MNPPCKLMISPLIINSIHPPETHSRLHGVNVHKSEIAAYARWDWDCRAGADLGKENNLKAWSLSLARRSFIRAQANDKLCRHALQPRLTLYLYTIEMRVKVDGGGHRHGQQPSKATSTSSSQNPSDKHTTHPHWQGCRQLAYMSFGSAILSQCSALTHHI
jgi:hypothetical protein